MHKISYLKFFLICVNKLCVLRFGFSKLCIVNTNTYLLISGECKSWKETRKQIKSNVKSKIK